VAGGGWLKGDRRDGGMSIRFVTREYPEFLELVCEGTYAEAEASGVFEQVFTLAANARRTAALIDARGVTGRPPTLMQRYNHAICITELYFQHLPRISLAILGHEPMVHRQRFGEIVAANRGTQARVFTDEASALNWLLARQQQP
jgi:hypothetical protein